MTVIKGFQFFKLGEWSDVVVDALLPMNGGRADRSATGEWWVPLTEKAYAKFCGSYDQIRGGCPCWALTDLSGGIAIQQKQESLVFLRDLLSSNPFCHAA